MIYLKLIKSIRLLNLWVFENFWPKFLCLDSTNFDPMVSIVLYEDGPGNFDFLSASGLLGKKSINN